MLSFLVKILKFLVKILKLLVKHRSDIMFATAFTLLNYSCFVFFVYVAVVTSAEEAASSLSLLVVTIPATIFASIQYHLFYVLVCEYYTSKDRRLKIK